MALPKLQHPTQKIKLPGNNKVVSIRPFTVKEEKLLLMAQTSGAEDIFDVVKQVIAACVTTPNFDVEKLPIFQVEYLFLKLRAFSVNNIIEVHYTDPEDENVYDLEVDLNTVEVQIDPDHTTKIELNDGIGVIMRYPDISLMGIIRQEAKKEENSEVSMLFQAYARCIEKVWDSEGVYAAGVDFTVEEAMDFLDEMTSEGFVKVQKFFDTVPALKHKVTYTTIGGQEKSVELVGLADFFL